MPERLEGIFLLSLSGISFFSFLFGPQESRLTMPGTGWWTRDALFTFSLTFTFSGRDGRDTTLAFGGSFFFFSFILFTILIDHILQPAIIMYYVEKKSSVKVKQNHSLAPIAYERTHHP